MASITLFIFAIFALVAFIYYKKDIIGPWFLLCAMMTLSFVIVLLNIENWEVVIVPKFTIYCSVMILSWFFGSVAIRFFSGFRISLSHNHVSREIKETQIKSNISEGTYPYLLLLCISVILTFFYLKMKLPTFSFSSIEAIKNTLRVIYDTEKTRGFFRTQIFQLIIAIAYISLYKRMSIQYLSHDRRMRLMLDIPVVLFLLCALVSTDRNILLRFMIYFTILYVMFFREQIKAHITKKLFVRVIILVLIAGGVFFSFGAAKQYTSNVTRAISIYGGSGLYNFNLWLKDFSGPYTHGKFVFAEVQNVLNALHLMSPSTVEHNAEFITYYSENGYAYSSNIYSAMRFYVQDFGIWGIIVSSFLIGALYEIMYIMMKRRPYGFSWVFYASMIYPVIYYPILDQFMKRMHFGRVYEIGWLVVFYFILFSAYGISKYRFNRRNFACNRAKTKLVLRRR